MNPQEHIAAALDFLALAEDSPIARQNRLLRSELLWCAAAHCVKAAANQYGWANASHDDLFRVVRRLARRIAESALRNAFNIASNLHKNMYEGQMSSSQLTRADATVRRFVDRVAAILEAYPRLPRRRRTQGR